MFSAEYPRMIDGANLFSGRRRLGMRSVVVTAVIGCLTCLCWGYLRNQTWLFFGALSALISVVALWLRNEARPVATVGWMVWQRCAAACLMLTLIEAGYGLWGQVSTGRNGTVESRPDRALKVVTFAEAQGDPYAFAEWWKVYVAEYRRNALLTEIPTPTGPVPYLMKPNTSRPFFQGRMSVNSLSLCDREISRNKGDKYRIVVMGSSHTQCAPIAAEDTPWPAKLERIIQDRMPAGHKVEVLNAGAGGYTMENNFHRLQNVVLPLNPDMIITYFGYNEFDWFREDFKLPRRTARSHRRPSLLLGKLDWRFRQWYAGSVDPVDHWQNSPGWEAKLAECRMARVYRKYLHVAKEMGIQLVVCDFNMAVDEHSPQDVVSFYEQGFSNVQFMIEANRLNSSMLPLVIPEDAGVRLIPVQDGLNGVWEDNYLDLVHMNEVGKQRLAENVYRGIVDLLGETSKPPTSSEPPARIVDRPEPGSSRQ